MNYSRVELTRTQQPVMHLQGHKTKPIAQSNAALIRHAAHSNAAQGKHTTHIDDKQQHAMQLSQQSWWSPEAEMGFIISGFSSIDAMVDDFLFLYLFIDRKKIIYNICKDLSRTVMQINSYSSARRFIYL